MLVLTNVSLTFIPLKNQFSSCLPSVWICWVGVVVPRVVCLPTGGQTLDQSLSISQFPSASWKIHVPVLLIIAAEPQTGFFVGFRQMLNQVSQKRIWPLGNVLRWHHLESVFLMFSSIWLQLPLDSFTTGLHWVINQTWGWYLILQQKCLCYAIFLGFTSYFEFKSVLVINILT